MLNIFLFVWESNIHLALSAADHVGALLLTLLLVFRVSSLKGFF